jgi:hypothetical protein
MVDFCRTFLGKGLHAKDGIPKIRPALESLCETYVGILDFHIPLFGILTLANL